MTILPNGFVQGGPEDRATWWTCYYCRFTGPLVGETADGKHGCMGSCGGVKPNPACTGEFVSKSGANGSDAGTTNSAVEINPGAGVGYAPRPDLLKTYSSDSCPDYSGENDTEFCKFILRADGSVLCETDRDWTLAYLSPKTALEFAKEILAAHTKPVTWTCADCGKAVSQQDGEIWLSAKNGFQVIHSACFKKRKDTEVGGDWQP